MDNLEQKFNHTHAPEGSVKSHRDALREKLQNTPVRSRSRVRASALTVALLIIVGATGLTVANPGWVKDLYLKVTTREIHFKGDDGSEIHLITKEVEAPDGSVIDPAMIEGDGPDLSWTLDPNDPNAKQILESGQALQKTMHVDASVTGAPADGKKQMKLIVENKNGNEVYILNGDTLKNPEEIQAIQSQQTVVRHVMDNLDENTATTESAPALPSNIKLEQNYPNPFNPSTTIPFELKEAGNVTIKVYDLTGREVKTLVNGYQSAGSHTVTFDGTGLASGTYLYKIDANGIQLNRTMILMK